MIQLGLGLHPGHRAVVPDGFGCDEITSEPVQWSTGQPAATAAAVIWAIGRVRPNTGWLPPEMLDEHGFVKVTRNCGCADTSGSSPSATSRRPTRCAPRPVPRPTGCWRTTFGPPDGGTLKTYRAPRRRWGSVLGIQPDGLEVFAPSGKAFKFPAWSIDRVLMPWIVRRGIYGGIRPNQPPVAPHETLPGRAAGERQQPAYPAERTPCRPGEHGVSRVCCERCRRVGGRSPEYWIDPASSARHTELMGVPGDAGELSGRDLVDAVLRELSEAADRWEAIVAQAETTTYSVDLGDIRAVADSTGKLVELTLHSAVTTPLQPHRTRRPVEPGLHRPA